MTIDTAQLGQAVRNLTHWKDMSASGVVFAIGNALFASVFFGRRAIFVLWLAFLAAFLLPLRDASAGIDLSDLTSMAADALDGLKDVFTSIRERFAPGM